MRIVDTCVSERVMSPQAVAPNYVAGARESQAIMHSVAMRMVKLMSLVDGASLKEVR